MRFYTQITLFVRNNSWHKLYNNGYLYNNVIISNCIDIKYRPDVKNTLSNVKNVMVTGCSKHFISQFVNSYYFPNMKRLYLDCPVESDDIKLYSSYDNLESCSITEGYQHYLWDLRSNRDKYYVITKVEFDMVYDAYLNFSIKHEVNQLTLNKE